MKRILRSFYILFALVLAGAQAYAQERERIISFNSDIEVEKDGSLSVRERILVYAGGQQIRRGIFRDFPTHFSDPDGNRYAVGFEVLGVTRDGEPERHRIESMGNGKRLRIGEADKLLRRGRHVYVITYRATHQILFLEGHDQLYWNVTGNGWPFDIDKVAATVRLPGGARALRQTAYTGASGTRGQAYRSNQSAAGILYFETTRPLGRREGLTIVVAWPSGIVAKPGSADKLVAYMKDNLALPVGAGSLLTILLYYLFFWTRHGRDPLGEPIVAQYEPPAKISPGAAHYISNMGFDEKGFTACIVSMAVKGFLKIHQASDETYSLEKTGASVRLSAGERAVAKQLFGSGRNKIRMDKNNHAAICAARDRLGEALRTEFEHAYFRTNSGLFLTGLGLSLAALLALVMVTGREFMTSWIGFFLLPWAIIAYPQIRKTQRAFRFSMGGGGPAQAVSAVFASLYTVPLLGLGAAMLVAVGIFVSAATAGFFSAIVALNMVFYHLLKAPTRRGRAVMDKIEGFRIYLEVGEKARMEFHNPPELTPELFERYLPYAIALEVDHSWSEQFSNALAAAGIDLEKGEGYGPTWFIGTGHWSQNPVGFSSDLTGGLSNAVVSSVTPTPGSGSASGGFAGSSGGGGFSGDGFGDGGGGW